MLVKSYVFTTLECPVRDKMLVKTCQTAISKVPLGTECLKKKDENKFFCLTSYPKFIFMCINLYVINIIMANTYTQVHIHAVFAVQNRLSLIQKKWQEELYQYITGIVENTGHNHKLLQIGGMPDHIHVLIGMRPAQSLSDLMQDIKGSS